MIAKPTKSLGIWIQGSVEPFLKLIASAHDELYIQSEVAAF
jgi:hypothetical protein